MAVCAFVSDYADEDLAAACGAPFSDPRIFVVSPDHPESFPFLGAENTRCHFGKDWNGPGYLTVGPTASDDSLQAASKRFQIPLHALQEFRAAQWDLGR
jgi:hypothetical protein